MSIKVMSMVFDANGLKPSQKLVMLSLSDHGAEDGSRIYPSVETTTKKTGLSERQVRRTLAELRKLRLIFVVKKAGQHRATEYAISIKTLKDMDSRPATVAPLEESRPDTVAARPATVAPNPLETSKESETLLRAPKTRTRSAAEIEVERLMAIFTEETSIPIRKMASQAEITKLWRNPMRDIIALANGQSEWLIKETIHHMRKQNPALTIKTPNSLLGCAPDVWSRYRPKAQSVYTDPMQPYFDMLAEQEKANAQNHDAQ